MSPKCVYGEHEMQAKCPMLDDAYGAAQPCEPEPPSRDSANFASLLEREPPVEIPETHDVCRQTHDALSSAAERIKSLEDVLVAIRVKAASVASHYGVHVVPPDSGGMAVKALDEISRVIGETLDPCKPWCVLAEPGRRHEGACVPIEEDDRGE